MAITDYASLVTAVQDWLHRTDLAARIQDFIALGELHLNAEIQAIGMQATATVQTVAGSRFAPLPIRFLEPLSLTDRHGDEVVLSDSGSVASAAAQNGPGRPHFYAPTDQLEFDRASERAHTLTMYYRKTLGIQADGTNWLLASAPNAYLYAALAEAAPFIADPNQIGLWIAKRDEAIRRVNRSVARRKPSTLRTDAAISGGGGFNILRG